MVWIDSHDGPAHRIGRPTECPCCGAAKAFEVDVPDDDMAVGVGFACGAAVRWRSVFWASNSGSGCSESLVGVTECPSPGGRGSVQLFHDAVPVDEDDDEFDTFGNIVARLWWLGYRVQFVPSEGQPAAWFGHYQVTGAKAISDFVDHLASRCVAGELDFLPSETFGCGDCEISVEGRPGLLYQNCPKCLGLMSVVATVPRQEPANESDDEQRHRDGRDDFLRRVFG